MKILISCVPYDGGKSGISVYTRSLLEALRGQGHQLTLLIEPGAREFFPGYDCIEMPRLTRKAVISMLYHLLVLPFLIRWKQYDFCIIAAINRRAFAFYPGFVIGVVHDLAQYHIKGKYDRLRMFYLKTVLPFFVRRCPALVAISRSTRADMIRYWRVPEAKITLNFNGLPLLPPPDGMRWLEKNGLTPGGYVFYVSRIEHPGKNHLNLIRAFELLPPELTAQYQLVMAGSDWHQAETVHDYAEKSPLRDRIKFTGFIETRDLTEAYQGAALYVFPSFFEGFGLSLVEAMNCGTPCCASDCSSLGEIGADGAALLFPPDSPEKMAEALKIGLTDKAVRTRLMEKGRRRAADFDWNRHARVMVEIYHARKI